MQTFKQYLKEDHHNFKATSHRQDDVEAMAQTLQDECGEMIKAFRASKKVLLRGVSDMKKVDFPPVIGHAHIRKDRRPVDMGTSQHDLINSALASLNLPTRGDSLFTTTNMFVAKSWGVPHIVFVKDGWKGLVFLKLDSDEYAFYYLQDEAQKLLDMDVDYEMKVEKMAEYIKTLDPLPMGSNHTLSMAALDDNVSDILIKGDSYYGLSLHKSTYNQTMEVLSYLEISPENLR